MARLVPKAATRGSQKWLQVLVNLHPAVFDSALASAHGSATSMRIQWLSPLQGDEYAEYQDQAFLDRLGVALPYRPLASFWPRRGPVWDGLGVTDRGELLLVEAKSHIRELLSSADPDSETSLNQIRASLEETRAYLRAHTHIDWTAPLYQYANRLAHLYLLRVLNGLPAFLVMLYFVNDYEQSGPSTQEEWQGAITLQKTLLGLRRHKLTPYVLDIFIDVSDLE